MLRTHASSPAARSSVFSSFLRRHDHHAAPEHEKFPLLTLRLSSPSFLDALVYDDVTERPLYTIKTTASFTTIYRADPWDGATKTAEIQWPRNPHDKTKCGSDDVAIQLRGVRWIGSETFLRRGSIRSSRKFNIPNYPHSLKWRQVAGLYWCETTSVKGPIAIFDPSDDSFCPRLTIYETFHDKYDARPILIHHGVSLLLIDYLIVTALFLVTDPQDWSLPENFTHVDVNITSEESQASPSLQSPTSSLGKSTTDLQWRKIMYGEPLFPKQSRSSLSSTSTSSDGVPQMRITADQMAKLAYGHPLYPKLRTSTPDLRLSDSEEEEDDQQLYFSPIRTRPPSPAPESVFDPRSVAGAPSHNYLDPSFYNKSTVPPVPPIPIQYTKSSGSTSRVFVSGSPSISRSSVMNSPSSPHGRSNSSSRPTSSYSPSSPHPPQELPELPPVLPLIPRPRSTPPRPMTSPTTPTRTTSQAPPQTPSDTSATLFPPQHPPTGLQPRRPSRQLPQPPVAASVPVTSSMRSPATAVPPLLTPTGPPPPHRSRSRSYSLHQQADKWSNPQQRQRTLPSPPTAMANSSRSHGGALQELDQGPYPHHSGRALKDCGGGGDDVPWVVTGAAVCGSYGAGTVGGRGYDLPPPAYNSINFSTLPGAGAGAAQGPVPDVEG